MFRSLLSLLPLLILVGAASAEPPSDAKVAGRIKLPPQADFVVVNSPLVKSVFVPVRGFGVVQLPELWRCSVYLNLPNAPAGAPPAYFGRCHFFTLAE